MDTDDIFSLNQTNEQLAELRAKSVAEMMEFANANGHDGSQPILFTCDTCGLRPKCIFAFDGYNTDGDCLADK